MVYGRHAHTGPRHARPALAPVAALLRRPRKRTWQALTSGLSAVALLMVCGLSSYFIVADERQGRDAQASGSAAPTALPRDISSREVDAAPLTTAEVFPGREIRIGPGEPPYRVLKTQSTGRCRLAATGELGKLLADLGCAQVVRATLRSPTGKYLVTAGVFNLDDVEGANWAHMKIKPMVDTGRGRFAGLVAGRGTEPVALASAQVGWHVRGHYLVYCVIARADGKTITARDPYAPQILFDMIELHLRGTVLAKRATRSAA
ncbi:hypothetical protein [Phytohabitans rumicis]|uniref:DUF5642 domain-containing protein n=1 Tax=Phytohabitans rumicis TaxID=1076125 RepID=A0A6V8LAT8_9ACTN|nr:hypothetical protein [Phytohabitans rumicis]GFJ89795.1 hypothetical protein Prum_034370 [Phytohabitans rumicis]